MLESLVSDGILTPEQYKEIKNNKRSTKILNKLASILWKIDTLFENIERSLSISKKTKLEQKASKLYKRFLVETDDVVAAFGLFLNKEKKASEKAVTIARQNRDYRWFT